MTSSPDFGTPAAKQTGCDADAFGGQMTGSRQKRVLLVEDHACSRAAMRLLLKRRGLDVVTAGSVQEAIERQEQQAFDLLISDLGLPDGGGQELLLQLRTRNPRLKAIAVTGRQREDPAPGFESDQFDVRLLKPVEFEQLAAAIDRMLKTQEAE